MQAQQREVTLSRVAGYRAWQAMGRQVVKGAKSFAVRAPVRRRLTTEEATERARTGQRPAFDADERPALVVHGFRLERVFRYEDTEGEPLPEAPEVGYVTGDTPAGAWDALAVLVTRAGYRLTAEAEDGDTRGHTNFTKRVVNGDPRYELAERVHILVPRARAHPLRPRVLPLVVAAVRVVLQVHEERSGSGVDRGLRSGDRVRVAVGPAADVRGGHVTHRQTEHCAYDERD